MCPALSGPWEPSGKYLAVERLHPPPLCTLITLLFVNLTFPFQSIQFPTGRTSLICVRHRLLLLLADLKSSLLLKGEHLGALLS